MAVLVLLRHGESAWNAKDVFTGWIDVGLSELGRQQAERGGLLLADRGFFPDIVHTSVQRRAIWSADLALAACGRSWVPVRRSWRLNSNHYGALQGRSKAEVCAEAGLEQFMAWRRGFRVRPPLGEPDTDPRYATLPPDSRPRGESLHDVTLRLLPYWCDMIVPDLCERGCVLVVSHGNTLRALVKHLEAVSDEAVAGLEVPNASPLCYEFRAGGVTRITDAPR
jgi:2,3-bisphosphoglycerate-dependent phosphoglycerate mutase